jgi:hypothetical protein
LGAGEGFFGGVRHSDVREQEGMLWIEIYSHPLILAASYPGDSAHAVLLTQTHDWRFAAPTQLRRCARRASPVLCTLRTLEQRRSTFLLYATRHLKEPQPTPSCFCQAVCGKNIRWWTRTPPKISTLYSANLATHGL